MAKMSLLLTPLVGINSSSQNNYSITDIRRLQRALKAIDPKFRADLIREAKEPAKPIQSAVKSAIPAVAPLSGLNHGRLNWSASVDGKGRSHSAKDVKIQFRTSSSGKSLTTSLVRVRVASPAVVFADMAGRSGRFIGAGYKGSGKTREYAWKGTTRSHRVDGNGVKKPNRVYKYASQGRALIDNLGGSASRFVWPAAERAVPAARIEINKVLDKFARKINRKGI